MNHSYSIHRNFRKLQIHEKLRNRSKRKEIQLQLLQLLLTHTHLQLSHLQNEMSLKLNQSNFKYNLLQVILQVIYRLILKILKTISILNLNFLQIILPHRINQFLTRTI